jgi:hypothetical protein
MVAFGVRLVQCRETETSRRKRGRPEAATRDSGGRHERSGCIAGVRRRTEEHRIRGRTVHWENYSGCYYWIALWFVLLVDPTRGFRTTSVRLHRPIRRKEPECLSSRLLDTPDVRSYHCVRRRRRGLFAGSRDIEDVNGEDHEA